jgi:HEAT repeat protein
VLPDTCLFHYRTIALTIMNRLAAIFQIRSGEMRLVALVASLFALIEAGRGLGSNTADALFFLRFGVENLPYMFMLLGATNFMVSLTYAASLGKFDKRRFFVLLQIALAVVLLIERAAIALDVAVLYPILWITVNVISSILGLLSWNIASEVCDTRQAKRLFALFVSAGILGSVVGNFMTGPLAQAIGTENLLIVYAAVLIIVSVIIRQIVRQLFKPIVKRGPSASFVAEVRAGFDYVRASSMFKTMAVASVLFSLLYFSISFPFSTAVAAAFPTEADVAGFLGVFSGIATAITFVVSLFMANRLYAHIGVVNAVLLLPIVYFVGFVLLALNFALPTASLARLSQLIVLGGIAGTAYSTFFNVVPPHRRGQVRSFDSGVPEQIGVALSGVLLILGEHVLPPAHIFIMGMIVAVTCGCLVLRLRRSYGEALLAALRAGRYEVFTAGERAFSGFQGDANAIRVITSALHEAKPSTRRIAVEMLARMKAATAIANIRPLLRDADADVRAAAIRALGDLDAHGDVESIVALLGDPDASVRAAAARTVADLQPEATSMLIATIEARLQDDDRSVRLQSALALAKIGQAARALPMLAMWLHDPDAHLRALTLETLGEIAAAQRARHTGAGVDVEIVRQAFHDAAPITRRAACRALALIQDETTIEPLIDHLGDPDPSVRGAAAAALQAFGSQAISRVLHVLEVENDVVEEAALDALTPNTPELLVPLQSYARREITQLRSTRDRIAALSRSGRAIKLLSETLEAHAAANVQRLIRTIGLIGNAEAMALIGKSLRSRDGESRAEAIEALDTLGHKQLARQIIPLLEETPASERSCTTTTAITALLLSNDRWVCALAARAIPEAGLRELIPDLHQLNGKSDPLIRAAAHEALIELGEVKPMETLQTMSIMERVLLLHEVPMFAALSLDDLKQIADIAREQWYGDDATICREGEEGHELFVLASGQVRVTKAAGEAEKFLAVRSAGDFIGEMAILEATPRSATVRASGEVRTLVIDGDLFKTILRDRPDVSFAVLRGVMKRMREKE